MRIPMTWLGLLVVGTILVACRGGGSGFSQEKFDSVGMPGLQTEREVTALLGPGELVRDSYTESIVTAHRLPTSARFLRYRDPHQTNLLYHVVLVDGRVAEKDVWDTEQRR